MQSFALHVIFHLIVSVNRLVRANSAARNIILREVTDLRQNIEPFYMKIINFNY